MAGVCAPSHLASLFGIPHPTTPFILHLFLSQRKNLKENRFHYQENQQWHYRCRVRFREKFRRDDGMKVKKNVMKRMIGYNCVRTHFEG